MACISAPTAALAGGAISGGGSLVSGLLGSNAATSAANTQAKAATAAANTTKDIYNSIRSDLAPYRSTGQDLNQYLYSLLETGTLPSLTEGINLTPPTAPAQGQTYSGVAPVQGQTFAPSMATLRGTPGYQFSLQQGSKAAQNALAASGLGAGGPAAIGASKYAEGLAETTYQDQYKNWLDTQNLDVSKFKTGFGAWYDTQNLDLSKYNASLNAWLDSQNLNLSQKQLIYNMLSGGAQLGESAAAGTASAGTQIAGTYGSQVTAAGAAKAAGTVGSTNALTSGISGAGSSALSTASLLALLGGSGSGTTSGVTDTTVNNLVDQNTSANPASWNLGTA